MDELKAFLSEEEYKSVMELAQIMMMPDPTHIELGDAEYVLSIPEGEVLTGSGKISKFKLKQAQKYVKDNSAFFADGWNNYTNGIKISA